MVEPKRMVQYIKNPYLSIGFVSDVHLPMLTRVSTTSCNSLNQIHTAPLEVNGQICSIDRTFRLQAVASTNTSCMSLEKELELMHN